MRLSLTPLVISAALFAQTLPRNAPPGVVTTRQLVTPAGLQTVFDSRVRAVTFGGGNTLWVTTGREVIQLDWRENRVIARSALQGTAGLQSLAASGGGVAIGLTAREGRNRPPRTELALFDGQSLKTQALGGEHLAGALAIAAKPNSKGQRMAAVALTFNNELAVVDLNAPGVEPARIKTQGIAPVGVAISAGGDAAYVSNWGGRTPKPGEPALPAGPAKGADQVVVDSRGIAATGSVVRVDLAARAVTHNIPAGLHPTGLAWDEARGRLYTANNNQDSITVIDTVANRVTRTIPVQPFAGKTPGVAPSALTLSADGQTLWVACGGINAIAKVRTADGVIEGLIPTGWYPAAVTLSADGKYLAAGTTLGIGSGWRDDPSRRRATAYRGTVSVIPVPDPAQLASYTTAVAENNFMSLGKPRAAAARRNVAPVPVPERAGEPSTIEHVVYIIKENRTYDQVFGDIPKGNGDPSLVMYGRAITPNAHKLAEEFVLLDNFYASGGNSADGHQWLTQSNQTAYTLWPGYEGRSYPYDGSDPIAPASGGFLWDYALAAGKTVEIFGEYAGEAANPAETRQQLLERWRKGSDFSTLVNHKAPMPSVDKLLVRNFPAYNTEIPDVVLAEIFKGHVERWTRAGKMPNLVTVQLPSDHTHGTRPGTNTPRAMVADNDLALGTIVESLTHSPFWKKMAIFVVEDDAQDGVDHVDGHRTVALAISPYTRRGGVDSTFYSNQSMVKTIELILGLPTMSLFDMIAHDMRASFTSQADWTPYTKEAARYDIFEQNPPRQALNGAARRAAADSGRMNFRQPDRAPTGRLNRILWGDAKGWSVPYPGPRRAVFAPLSVDIDDEEREERKVRR